MAIKKTAANMPAATPLELTSLVDYQQDAVVSRTLLQDDIGTYTVFSFDQGQGLSEHTSPFDAFVQVLEGQAEITIGGRPISVEAGQLILMPGGVPHKLQATRPFKMLLTLFRTGSGGKGG